jgi:hypothetical protein
LNLFSLGQSNFNLNFTSDNRPRNGSGSTDFSINSSDINLGLKTGEKIYFKIELVYGIGNIHGEINFVATPNGIT